MYIFRIASDNCCLLLVVYTYEPLDSDQFYLPPSKDDYGDQSCGCNAVIYKYEIQTP